MDLREELHALARTVELVRKHKPVRVSEEEYQRRLDICAECKNIGWFRKSPQCRKCGCFLKVKAWLAEFHCDLDKW